MSAETATLVVVDPATAVADKLRDTLGEQSHAEVVSAASLDDARSLLGTVDPGCLVINLDSIDDADGRSFVADAGTDCPIVLLTNSGRELVDDDLLTRTTTVVERADDPDWGFLLEKIQRHLGTTPSTGSDEQLYRNLVESARDGLYRLDANGRLVYANESWADILGYDREEMLGSHASIAMAEGELERGQQVIQQVLEDDDRESEIIDVEMRTKSGERITVAVHFVVLTTEEGAYDGVMGVARDVTERRRDEQKLQEQNERLDEFASVVSHDLRNPHRRRGTIGTA